MGDSSTVMVPTSMDEMQIPDSIITPAVIRPPSDIGTMSLFEANSRNNKQTKNEVGCKVVAKNLR